MTTVKPKYRLSTVDGKEVSCSTGSSPLMSRSWETICMSTFWWIIRLGECRYAFRIHEGDDRQAGTDMNLWEYDTTLRNFTRFRIRRAWVKTPRPSTSTSCGRCTTEPWRRASAHNSIRSNTSKRASPRPRSGPWHSMRFDKSETCNWRIALKWNMPGICSCRTSTCVGCRS